MRRLGMYLLLLIFTNISFSLSKVTRFGEALCHTEGYSCIKARAGESWGTLFPNEEERDIVQRANRMNTPLKSGMTLAVPHNLETLSLYDVSPFPLHINSKGEKTIFVSQKKLAWAAFDETGVLVWWGPISPGMSFCPNVYGGCVTPTGAFRMIRKQDYDCYSTAFPKRPDGNNGGTAMPYCMHFFRGYALHGSNTVPGYPASHGCIRLFIQDARWLNEEFVTVPGDGELGTRVIIDEA